MSLGKSVLRMRQEKHLTQLQVAQRASLATSYLSRIENDHIQPTTAMLRRLAEALGVGVAELFHADDGGGVAKLNRCPVSSSGECIGQLIRSHHGRPPGGGKARYGKEELRLLRMTEFLALRGSPQLRNALRTVLESFVAHAGGKPPRT